MADRRIPAVLALAAVGGAAGLSLARVFAGLAFVGPVVGAVIAAHALGQLARARRWSLARSELASVVALLLYLAWVIEPNHTAFGVPGPGTWHALSTDLSSGLALLKVAVAPTRTTPGLLLLAAGGAFVCAHAADLVAFRLGATLQALVPSFVLFLVASALGTHQLRYQFTAAFALSAALFLLVQSATLRAEGTAWVTGRSRRHDLTSLTAGGVPIAAVATVAALLIGPAVPGAHNPPILEWKGVANRADLARQTISPLVDLKPRLTKSPEVELFTVRSPAPENWRVTALDEFDGRTWTSVGTYHRAGGTLAVEPDDTGPTTAVRQEYAIGPLDTFWLPAAYRPTHIALKGARVHNDSLTLLTERATADGLRYTVDSAVPRPDPVALSHVAPAPGYERYLRLPVDFPTDVRALARNVTRGATSPYVQARMLQDYLRSNFRYNEAVPAGHSNNQLRYFLFVSREGYCEQFAGAFAAMARSIGIPTRVAVGFTPGRYDGTAYHVFTSNAHAWPEIHLAGFGWVAFEPTPGRYELAGSNYTGTYRPQPVETPASAEPPGTTASTAPTTASTLRVPKEVGGGSGGRATRHGPHWLAVLTIAVVTLVLLAGAYAATVLSLAAVRRRRRTSRADPRARVAGAWEHVLERLSTTGVGSPYGATPCEVALRAVRLGPQVAAPLDVLARLHTRSWYAPADPTDAEVAEAWDAALAVTQALDAGVPWTRRWSGRLRVPRPVRRPFAGDGVPRAGYPAGERAATAGAAGRRSRGAAA